MRLLFVIATLLVLAASAYAFLRFAPDRYNPFAPIVIDEPPSFLTRYKLKRLAAEPLVCFAALREAGVEYVPVVDEETGDGCGFENAAVLERSTISWGGGIRMTCPMLAAISVWERHDLQPAAVQLFGRPIVRIDHFGTYACRNVNNEATGRRSEHARANAVDVAGFMLEGGDAVSVLEHWEGDDVKADFLRTVRDGACARFSTVLGPDYNAAHANHFHFDMGRFGICR